MVDTVFDIKMPSQWNQVGRDKWKVLSGLIIIVAGLVRHRHECLLDSDINAKEYMPLPPLVSWTRTKNLRDTLIRAKLPPPAHRQGRDRGVGFRKCGKRTNCVLCQHSEPGVISQYTCPVTSKTVNISSNITCTDKGVYLLYCGKDNGLCNKVHPTYVGECGDGETSSFTHRLASHLGIFHSPVYHSHLKQNRQIATWAAIAIWNHFILYMKLFSIILFLIFHFKDFSLCITFYISYSMLYNPYILFYFIGYQFMQYIWYIPSFMYFIPCSFECM